jgi:hypothetical protein
MSPSVTVPAPLPLLFHGSENAPGVDALKKIWPP